MAQIAIAQITDGPRNAVYHVSILGDGSGDLVDAVIIDPATSFSPPLPSQPALKIEKLWYDLSGFDAWIEFDYLTSDTPVWSMSAEQGVQLDFSWFGGLSDLSLELDGSGKLLLSTNGLGIGDHGTIVVMAKKS